MSTCKQLALQTLGSQLVMPINLLDHRSGRDTLRLLGIYLRPFAQSASDTKYYTQYRS